MIPLARPTKKKTPRRDNPEARMALGEHLRELRRRFLLVLLGLVVGGALGWLVYDQVFDLLLDPIRAIEGGGEQTNLNFTDVMGPFDMKVRLSLFIGTLVSSPWWLAQLWLFIAPGLTRREKVTGLGVVAAGVPLFLGGAFLAWSVLPNAVRLLTGATPDGTLNLLTAAEYLTFVMQFILIFGAAFLLPLIMVALTAVGVVRGTTWRRGWRWAIVGIFTFAAFATPSPDALSMVIMALPICGLYGLALTVCWWLDRRRERRLAEPDTERAGDDAGDAAVA